MDSIVIDGNRSLMIIMSLQELVSHMDHLEHTSGHLLVDDSMEQLVMYGQICAVSL